MAADYARHEQEDFVIRIRAVIIPFFAGLGTGVGISVKRVGIGIPWIQIHSGIESTAGIGSTLL